MAISYLLVGGNQGERISLQEMAAENIERSIGKILKKSSYYETEPWGFADEQYFLNSMLEIETELSPWELLNQIHTIEKKMGRIRKKEQYSSRTIDIDIIFYDKKVICSEKLTVPHPKFHERLFAIMPMMEINKGFIHPSLGKTILEIKQSCKDKLAVKRLV